MRHTPLARAVAGHESPADEGEQRRGIDDAAVRPGEKRTRGGAKTHRACQVDVEHFGEHGGIVLRTPADDAGAVDQDVERWQRREKCSDRGIVAHVERIRAPDRSAAVRLGRLGLGCARDGDDRTELGQCIADRRADAASAARDEHLLVAKRPFLKSGRDHEATASARSAMTCAWRGSGATAP